MLRYHTVMEPLNNGIFLGYFNFNFNPIKPSEDAKIILWNIDNLSEVTELANPGPTSINVSFDVLRRQYIVAIGDSTGWIEVFTIQTETEN